MKSWAWREFFASVFESKGLIGKVFSGIRTYGISCRPLTPLTLEDARRLIQIYVDHYNTVRLHSAIGYVTPQDRLAGRQAEIHAARDRKLEEARRQRQLPAADDGFEV
jgi:Integrase core domain